MLQDISTNMERDTFFRGVSPDWYTTTDGDVEHDSWFGLLRIDTEFRQAHSSTSTKRENSEMPEGIADGLYLVKINDHGTVWCFGSTIDNEDEVRDEYVAMARDYSASLAEEHADQHEMDEQEARTSVQERRVLVDPSKLVLGEAHHVNSVYPGSDHPSSECPGLTCSLSSEARKKVSEAIDSTALALKSSEAKRLRGSVQLQEVYRYLDVPTGTAGNRNLAWYGQCRAQERTHLQAIADTMLRFDLRREEYWASRFPEGDGFPGDLTDVDDL